MAPCITSRHFTSGTRWNLWKTSNSQSLPENSTSPLSIGTQSQYQVWRVDKPGKKWHVNNWHVDLLLLMEEILHQLIGSSSHYLQGLHIPGGAGFLPSTVVGGWTNQTKIYYIVKLGSSSPRIGVNIKNTFVFSHHRSSYYHKLGGGQMSNTTFLGNFGRVERKFGVGYQFFNMSNSLTKLNL